MQLIYRGHSYTCNAHAKPTHQACAINWRYQLLGADLLEIQVTKRPPTMPSSRHCVMNWRYQMPREV